MDGKSRPREVKKHLCKQLEDLTSASRSWDSYSSAPIHYISNFHIIIFNQKSSLGATLGSVSGCRADPFSFLFFFFMEVVSSVSLKVGFQSNYFVLLFCVQGV